MFSLILGIAAVVAIAAGYLLQSVDLNFLIWVGAVLGLIAWIVGAKAVKKNKSNKAARAGKVLGIIATIIGIILVVLTLLLAGAFMSMAAGL